MKQRVHLYVAVSGHGFGHLAQVAPVLNEWRHRNPTARLTVQSVLPPEVLQRRIVGTFECVTGAADFGMVMVDALDAKIPESLAAYRAFHAEWASRLRWQEDMLRAAAPDGVLADIPYLSLAGAARLDIPALALCSLNWADILAGYCRDAPDIETLCRPMLDAYNSAQAFLQPAPSIPMPAITKGHPIGPIAALGEDRRSEIGQSLGWPTDETWVLMGLGGINTRPSLENWPQLPGIWWLTPPEWNVARSDMASWTGLMEASGLNCSMLDLVRSCDVLFTKPGYGAFTEAACNGTRVLYVERDDWPEEPWLSRWLLTHGTAVKIDRQTLKTGDLANAFGALLAQPAKPPVVPSGVAEAAACIERLLG